jgi:hypothetical protein
MKSWQWSLSWAIFIQLTSSMPVSLTSILMLSSLLWPALSNCVSEIFQPKLCMYLLFLHLEDRIQGQV